MTDILDRLKELQKYPDPMLRDRIEEVVNTIESQRAEIEELDENIDLKAEFIERTLNQSAEDYRIIQCQRVLLERAKDFLLDTQATGSVGYRLAIIIDEEISDEI